MAAGDNARLVRRFYDAFNAEDLDAFAATLDDEVEIVSRRGVRCGVDEARAWARRSPAGHLSQRIELDDVVAEGEVAVALIRKQWWWREEGELAEERPEAALFTVRDGRIARWEPFAERSEALRSAGICGD